MWRPYAPPWRQGTGEGDNKSQNIFFERFLKAQESYNIFSLIASNFTLKIPTKIFAYLITKRDAKLYLLCNESCFSGTTVPFLSINCLFENRFSVAELQKYLLHVSAAYFIFQRNSWNTAG